MIYLLYYQENYTLLDTNTLKRTLWYPSIKRLLDESLIDAWEAYSVYHESDIRYYTGDFTLLAEFESFPTIQTVNNHYPELLI